MTGHTNGLSTDVSTRGTALEVLVVLVVLAILVVLSAASIGVGEASR